MDYDREIAELRSELRYIKDRMEILDCINRHARGHDRHDDDLIASAYFPDGVDEHGPVINTGESYAAWANAAHESLTSLHTHNITTHSCQIDGDIAHAESYVIVCLLAPDMKTATFASGRYVDRLERRDGEWRIALRRTITDVVISGDASWLLSDGMKGYPKGVWDKSDASYHRPLLLENPVACW